VYRNGTAITTQKNKQELLDDVHNNKTRSVSLLGHSIFMSRETYKQDNAFEDDDGPFRTFSFEDFVHNEEVLKERSLARIQLAAKERFTLTNTSNSHKETIFLQ